MNDYLTCPHRNVQSFTEYCLDCGWNIWTTEKEYYAAIAAQRKREKPNAKDDYEDSHYEGDF